MPPTLAHPLRWLVPVLLWIGWAAVDEGASRHGVDAGEETRAAFAGHAPEALPGASGLRASLAALHDGPTPVGGAVPPPPATGAPAPLPTALDSPRAPAPLAPAGLLPPALRCATAHPSRGPPLPIG